MTENDHFKAQTLLCDAEYMTPAMKDTLWYVRTEVETVKVDMKKVVIP